MRRLALLFGLLLFLPLNLASSPSDSDGWFAFDAAPRGAEARVETATPVADGIDLSVRIPGVLTRTIETKAGPRGVLTIPEGGVTAEVGHPRLPVLRTLVEVPPGATIHLDIEVGESRRVTLAELGLAARLLPVQPPIPKLEGARELAPFVEDTAAFAEDRFLPETPVAVVHRAVLRGRHVAQIELRPIRYNPTAGAVEVWSEAEVKVRFEGGRAEVATRNATRLTSRPMDQWLTREIEGLEPPVNAPAVPMAGGPAEGALGMLVIAEDDYVAAVQPLLDWKRQTGYKVELVRMSVIGSSPSDSDVKAVLQARYVLWSAPALDFLLLVGDTHVVPIHTGNGGGSLQVTDNWYACLDGSDYLPEIAVARISTRSAQETADVVDKLMTYEQATFPDDAWIKDCGFIGTADSGHVSLIEGTHDDCIDGYYIPNFYRATPWSHGYAACDRHFNTTNSVTSEISDSIDAGRSMINYSGHGGNNSWEGPTYSGGYGTSDVRANTNDGMYPFVISNACVTGSLADTECFAETWQKVPNAGAIGFWGASNNSYWDEDDVLQRDTHDNLFPMDETPPLGVLINETKLDLYDHYGPTGNVAYYFDMYNLLSEPSLSMWTRHPRTVVASYPAAAPIGQATLTVTVTSFGQPIEGALVAVLKDDEGVFEAGHTGTSGSVDLILDPAPQNVGSMLVTVTGHDIDPHEGTVEIVSPDSPWLIYRSHAADDSAGGDGDGSANPGEDLVLAVTVENVGGQPAYGVASTMTTSTPQWAEVLEGAAAYPDMETGELGTSLGDHYTVRVKPEAPDGAYVGFDIAWTAGSDSGITSFSELVTAVNLALDGFTIEDFLMGNGNGVAGPGETVDMRVTLGNVGHKNATGIHGVLSSESPYVAILQGTADYSDIVAGGTGSSQAPLYSFAVDPGAPDQEPVTFTLTVTEAGSGYSNVIVFDVIVSSCAITSSVDVPKAITDNTTIQSELYYPHSLEIEDLDVFVDITHTYQGDLHLTLVSPVGTEVILHAGTGGSANDIITWYDDETTPYQPLSAFFGEDAEGTWILIVEDDAGSDQGTLNDWKLELCGQGTAPVPAMTVTGRHVDDSAGCDPDGNADVGETVWLSLDVRNIGTAPATGVQVSIAAPDSLLLMNSTVLLADLAPDEEAAANFEVLVGAVGCLEEVGFVVDISANEGNWFDGFDLILEADRDGESFPEDLEHFGLQPASWSHTATQGTDDWIVTSSKNHTAGGAWSWSSSAPASLKDDRLVSPGYSLGPDSWLEFWHWVDLQSGRDGGVLEISDNSGLTWVDAGPYIVVGGYDRMMDGNSPIEDQYAWSGSFPQWRRVVVDLSSFEIGRAVKLRWRLTCDDAIASAGWWVDDIVVHAEEAVCDVHPCGIPGEVQLTSLSMNSADVLIEWADDPLCLDFKVWRTSDPMQAATFVDVTAEDADPTDASFLDTSAAPLLYWIIQGHGPDGDGPWGHYER